ncbi:ectoine/hydroxyectoine ABC transporter permease subunit EhuD [Mesorhizobium sp. M1A.F.Ca.IN.022.07.1.1]|uniref:ectoine/hydroxyectoine ABC transporter permease subunit EhuD n=1 Tax=unclassified Mesorhizobium TaxID=325217 RepID=UPI000FCC4D36|nr:MULTISPECIES: ectoine/hydroxyectoine ABC transporter permease subunit EhuD [unclassified Mesorhizobium]RUV95196.1 ectoine/hydroxyectoine ABC transporter permease subunit EhuD [Mesorhizobium sp. M1A.F.Ca.IN.022.07.1.1]RWM65122.1 MAG: ectoine/hydroxyectoine ABC transporter permease subunit EhuD [Mesorhizobium sp.]RWM89584.1 MAG: ectoine/hydroxyectoine ABC transporter permease subunit EhuD [Mesorhizobium sp.]TIS71599.1 MAG: ectoine/hydroxyectoine ABC transporter permease subunit EhuD [Mesorhizo
MSWQWSFAWQIFPQLVEGMKLTILASLLGSALAMILGLAIAIGRRSATRAVAWMLSWVVDFIRGTPLLVQLYFVFYVLPDVGIYLSPLAAGVVTLGVHYSSYTSEVYRAGIDNLDRTLWEAAKALNLTRSQTWRYIIIPTAVPPMIPALANYVVGMFKETPLLATITVMELMNTARILSNVNYRYLEPMTMVGAFFLAVSVPSVMGLNYLERLYGGGKRRHPNMSIF